MKKVKNAFTLIELIVSISIIILVSLVSVSGFFDFLD
ncbi:MAG: prepilin-type N-terminal cleavage/methylation domain-containing protein [Candidatus Peribacteria bacterium]|nr:prepilin-type N-terminal cleavage/methylation domain-containing protein [Candidatus Peribacteria bacterium]